MRPKPHPGAGRPPRAAERTLLQAAKHAGRWAYGSVKELPARAALLVPLADRLEHALGSEVRLLALSLDERALMLTALEDPPQELTEPRVVMLPTTNGAVYRARLTTRSGWVNNR